MLYLVLIISAVIAAWGMFTDFSWGKPVLAFSGAVWLTAIIVSAYSDNLRIAILLFIASLLYIGFYQAFLLPRFRRIGRWLQGKSDDQIY